jgi:DNA-binding MarR family transcriptional regulator
MKNQSGQKFFDLTNEISNLMYNFDFMNKKCTRLGRVECNLLHYLLKVDKQVNMKELADFLNVTHSRITHLMDSLLKKDFVTRISSTDDRRVYYAAITEKGKNMVNKHINDAVKTYNDILPKLPEDKIDNIYEALDTWKNFLEALNKEKR